MKRRTRIGALVLAGVMMLSAILPQFTTHAEELPKYTAHSEFSTNQTVVWKYQKGYNNGGKFAFEDLEYNSENKQYGDIQIATVTTVEKEDVTGKASMKLHPGPANDAVVTFVAPHSGKVSVSMANGGVYCPLNGAVASEYDGINFYLFAGSKKILFYESVSSKHNPADKRVFTEAVTFDIRKNERIYFVVQANKTTANDTTFISPQIEYLSLSGEAAVGSASVPNYIGKQASSSGGAGNYTSSVTGTEKDGVYRLSQMFSDKMEEWSYYWFDNSNVYNEMAYNKETKGWSGKTETTNANTAGINASMSWHPYTSGYTTAAFTCPKSGTVTVGMESDLVLLNQANCDDGTIVTVVSDQEVLGEQILLTPDNPQQKYKAVSIDVYEGQVIYFYLYMNINNAGDSTLVTPYVKYTDYKPVEKKEITETDSFNGAEDRELRTDIQGQQLAEKTEFALHTSKLIMGIMSAVGVFAIVIILIIVIKRRKKNNA